LDGEAIRQVRQQLGSCNCMYSISGNSRVALEALPTVIYLKLSADHAVTNYWYIVAYIDKYSIIHTGTLITVHLIKLNLR
jgi:hypothetical protein